ncbi:MAG: metal dependent phosphohydrolase [Bacteroidetes bacterium]|nr:metal dependent phosphohydrolase [Bacteroidota bacterium]
MIPDGQFRSKLDRIQQFLRAPGNIPVKLLLAAGLLVALALMFPRGETLELDFKVGGIWAQKDLIAPFSFPVFRDEREYQRDVQEARQKVLQVFERDTLVDTRQLRRLEEFFRKVTEAVRVERQYRKDLQRRDPAASQDSLLFVQLASSLDIPFTPREWSQLDILASGDGLTRMHTMIAGTLREMQTIGILDRSKGTIVPAEVAQRRGSTEEILSAARLYDHADVVAQLEARLLQFYGGDNDTVSLAYKIAVMHVAPNVKFSEEATAQSTATAVDAVPRTIGFVQENERIVSKHERITPEIRLKLESLRRVKVERGPASDSALQLFGTMLHASIVVGLYAIYLYLFRKRIFNNNRRLALIALLIVMEGFFAYMSRELDVTTPIEYLIVVPAASMLLTIIFDSRVGFYGTVIIAFVVAGIRGNDYSVALAALVAGALSVYSVRDMKNRTQLFRSLGFIFVGYAASIISLGLERYEPLSEMLEQLTFALVNAIVSPVLTYGLLIFMERVFKVTTDLTLMELAHFNHPLLRMLAEKTPGTYHHSMTIASLAEAAAAAVGANEALVRVGAYFHDIGKVEKPTYFVENQKSSRSRHDKLSPRMSSLIIAAHVKDGIALAREYKLPEEVIDFIPMHHGTTRIDYFYNKALKLAENSEDETKLDEINEADYRYPGPKPQSKETGIMMLADAVEATARTIDDPTPQRIADAIDELVKRRLDEGELNECPLTLTDLTKIKAAFLSVLVGIYHTRVRYPEAPKPRLRRPRQKPSPEPQDDAPPQAEPLPGGDNE